MQRPREHIALATKLVRAKDVNDYREKSPFTQPKTGKRFDNPSTWQFWRKFGLLDLILWKVGWRPQSERAHNLRLEEEMNKLKVKTPYTVSEYKNNDLDPEDVIKRIKAELENGNIRATWLGHASVLVQFPSGLNCLIDPLFSQRASPVQFVGPKRNTIVPVTVQQLKDNNVDIHVIVISHDHYDHLDMNTINEFRNAMPETVYYVPKNTDKNTMKIRNEGLCREMNWWDEMTHSFTSTDEKNISYKVTHVPAQHWTKRGAFDDHQSLWGGYLIQCDGLTVYYSGDTGFCPVFNEIKFYLQESQAEPKEYPVDFAVLPIGAYLPRWFMNPQHVSPEECVEIYNTVGARHGLAIHWLTFDLADDRFEQPARELEYYKIMRHMQHPMLQNFVTTPIGEVKDYDCN